MGTIYACSILSAPPLSKASALHTTRHGVQLLPLAEILASDVIPLTEHSSGALQEE